MNRFLIKALAVFTLLPLLNSQAAIQVIKPEFKQKMLLRIVRVIPDGMETYSLSNSNGREMTLVCAKNRFYENNAQAFIEYRNFYNESAGKFIIESNEICQDMAKFIEQAHSAVDENRPFLITLNRTTSSVEKIVYPRVDPLADKGDINDLYLKKDVLLTPRPRIKLD